MTSDSVCRTVVDSHVHVYPHVPPGAALDVAARNLARLTPSGASAIRMLFLADPAGIHFAGRLSETSTCGWEIRPTHERESIVVRRGADEIAIILGQQLATGENLEVLAIGSDRQIENGLGIEDTLARIAETDGIAIVPWGFGKWLGSRGKILERVLRRCDPKDSFLGDNGGRPAAWGPVRHFRLAENLGIRILRGSDPLPLGGDERRIGSFGFGLPESASLDRPFESIRMNLRSSTTELISLGRPTNLVRAISNQARLRFAPGR